MAAEMATLAGMALLRVGITLAAAGMVAAVIGTPVTGMAGVAAGIMVVMVVPVGELAPQSVSVLALDYSEGRSRRLLITVVTTTATINHHRPVHSRQRFGIGAMPIRPITPRYPNAQSLGDKLFSNSK